jgi:GTP cyclohydrolase I
MTQQALRDDLDIEEVDAAIARRAAVTPLLVRRTERVVDLDAAEQAAADLMEALGLAPFGESMAATPRRMAKAYAELFSAPPFALTTFPNDEGYDELVVARNVPMTSVCEHHLLPFTGVASVGYLPGDRILGLSKLARVVDHFARRPQVQERLTMQVANWLQDHLRPRGVGVVIEAYHLCMMMRGVEKQNSKTVTSSLRGAFRDDGKTRDEFLRLVHGGSFAL